jgi:hypothetical protein
MPKLEAYLVVEATVAATIAAGWTKRARPIMAELEEALAAVGSTRPMSLPTPSR